MDTSNCRLPLYSGLQQVSVKSGLPSSALLTNPCVGYQLDTGYQLETARTGGRMGLKVRKSAAPPPPAGCPMQNCMKLLSGAWTPEVVWKLSGGPRRFGELRRDIARISPKMLTARLRGLE